MKIPKQAYTVELKELAVKRIKDGQSVSSAKELASTAGVRMVDREGLQRYLDDYNQKLIEVFQAEEESA